MFLNLHSFLKEEMVTLIPDAASRSHKDF